MIVRSKKQIYIFGVYFLLSFVALAVFLIINRSAGATEVVNDWSWTSPRPKVSSSVTVDDVASQYCAGSYRHEQIIDSPERWMCVQQGKNISVGMDATQYPYLTTVKFAYDNQMYPLHGTGNCETHGRCIYLPETDTLVTKQHRINTIVKSLVIYKNFTQRLLKITNEFGLTTSYSFDSTKPDYIFKSSDNYDWPVEGIGASNNEKWLAVEFRQRGFGILNIDTFEMKRFSTLKLSYGTGRDPTAELAVSDNGSHVALMGGNYGGVTTFDTYTSCMDDTSDRNMEFIIPMNKPCDQATIDTDEFINKFAVAYNPSFSSDATELNFYAKSYVDPPVFVSLSTTGHITPRLDYLALGDSFTSGEGELDDAYYQGGTNDEFEKCHLSKRSYPYIIANLLGIETQYMHSVACSGARTTDVTGKDLAYWGQGSRLKNPELGLNDAERVLYKAESVNSFTPGRIHQLTFVEKYKPKIITIGIGGNDVGLMEKLRTCVGVDICEWAGTAEGREKTALEIQTAFDTLVNTYTSVHDASPASKIYVIGYPKIIDQDGQCRLFDGILLDSVERQFMNEALHYVNQVISAAARRAGVAYIDVENSFGDRVLCGHTQPSVMNAIRTGDDSPISVKADWLKLIGSESFHPRPSAHINIANAITKTKPNQIS